MSTAFFPSVSMVASCFFDFPSTNVPLYIREAAVPLIASLNVFGMSLPLIRTSLELTVRVPETNLAASPFSSG